MSTETIVNSYGDEVKLLTKEEVIAKVQEILEQHTYLTRNENGTFQGMMYVAYDDSLSQEQLVEIMNAENKMDAFYEVLDEYVMERTMYEENEIDSLIENHWDDTCGGIIEYQETITDWVRENVSFNLEYEKFLNQDIRVNILVDTGDGNTDYTLNNFANYQASLEGTSEIDEDSSVLWLARQQGYQKARLERAVFEQEFSESEFLKSVYVESANTATSMNALGFFVSMSVKEFIDWQDNKGDITLSKGASCGLIDHWNGAGGPLEIKLEKDVTIPAKFAQPHMDGTRGYGVDSIYGMMGSFWGNDVIRFGTAGKGVDGE